MKFIKEYKEFAEDMKKLNEGGGAGKDFQFENVSFELVLEYSKDGIKETKKEVEISDELAVSGYNDSIGKLDSAKLFTGDIKWSIDEKELSEITFGDLIYNVGKDKVEQDAEMTFGEYVKQGNTLTFTLSNGGEVSIMYGGGYITPIVDKETALEVDGYDIVSDEGVSEFLEAPTGDEWNSISLLSDKTNIDIKIVLTPNEDMIRIYDEVFVNPETYEEYLDSITGEPLDEITWGHDRFEHILYEFGI